MAGRSERGASPLGTVRGWPGVTLHGRCEGREGVDAMNDFNAQSADDSAAAETISVEAIKARIADISSKPLSEHSDEFEAIHAQLQKALSGIDGL